MFKIIPILFAVFAFNKVLIAQVKTEKLSAIMESYHGYNMFDGAVLVAEEGKVIYKAAFGLANREWNIPNRVDTKFMIGSLSHLRLL